MFVAQLRHRFDFEDDLPEAHEVRLVPVFQRPIFISQYKLSLWSERNSTKVEFDLQALLINRFEESRSLDLVDLKASPHDPITLIRKQNHNPSFSISPSFHLSYFVYFVYFVVRSCLLLFSSLRPVPFVVSCSLLCLIPFVVPFTFVVPFYRRHGDERIDVEDERHPSVAEDACA